MGVDVAQVGMLFSLPIFLGIGCVPLQIRRLRVGVWGVDLKLGVVGGLVVGRLALYVVAGGGVCLVHLEHVVVGYL